MFEKSIMVARVSLAELVGSQVLEKTGATRRTRTGDLLITKNNFRLLNLT